MALSENDHFGRIVQLIWFFAQQDNNDDFSLWRQQIKWGKRLFKSKSILLFSEPISNHHNNNQKKKKIDKYRHNSLFFFVIFD